MAVTDVNRGRGYAHPWYTGFPVQGMCSSSDRGKYDNEWVTDTVDRLIVYGSKDCMGWQDVQALLAELRQPGDLDYVIDVRDPAEHPEEFRDKGLVVCPSYLFNGELIAVGVPRAETLRDKIEQRRKQMR